MKALVQERFGEPGDVLQLRDVPETTPGAGEVRVRMKLSPINPSDLMRVQGAYDRLPTLPATPGFEGCGVVDAVGPGWIATLRGLKPGRRVAVLASGGGAWQQQLVLSARHVVPVPDDVPDEQVASFFVNPATVIAMASHLLQVPSGAFLLQSAAGSSLGKMMIRYAKHQGFATINLVRRREQVEELRRAGAERVICTSDEDVPARVKEITRGAGVLHAIDPVGGATTAELLRCLAPGGKLLLYGSLSSDPVPLTPRLLITGMKKLEGFYLGDWAAQQGVLTMLQLFRQIKSLLRAGVLTTTVEATYPLAQFAEATTHAARPARAGKVLLKLE